MRNLVRRRVSSSPACERAEPPPRCSPFGVLVSFWRQPRRLRRSAWPGCQRPRTLLGRAGGDDHRRSHQARPSPTVRVRRTVPAPMVRRRQGDDPLGPDARRVPRPCRRRWRRRMSLTSVPLHGGRGEGLPRQCVFGSPRCVRTRTQLEGNPAAASRGETPQRGSGGVSRSSPRTGAVAASVGSPGG